MIRFVPWLMLTACVGGTKGAQEVREGRPGAGSSTAARFEEAFEVGPIPTAVLLVRHGEPTALEAERLQQTAMAWGDALSAQPGPWRVGVVAVGADPAVVPPGQLLRTPMGQPWIDQDVLDAGDQLVALQAPVATDGPGNPALDSLVATDLSDFVFPGGLMLVVFVSELDSTGEITGVVAAEWLDLLADQHQLVDVNLGAMTTLSGSACSGVGVGVRFLNLLSHVGGYELDICDSGAAARLAEGYGDDMNVTTVELAGNPRPDTIEVVVDHPDAVTPLEPDRDFVWDPSERTITVTSWLPPERVGLRVSYVPR